MAAGAELQTTTGQVAAAPRLEDIRSAIRALLVSSPAYQRLEPDDRRRLAQGMVRVCHAAALLKSEAADPLGVSDGGEKRQQALAMTQAAGGGFGVSITQIKSYVDLINNVAASTEGFADANIHGDHARQWLAERYPDSFELNAEPGERADDGTQLPATVTVVLKAGAEPPSSAALAVDLGIKDDEGAPPATDPEHLVPFVRQKLAKSRQEVLSTLVMLGMQRIVVESGKINAAMRFHIDTHSAAAEDKGSRFESETGIKLHGQGGMGIWSVSADITENIGYVSTQKEQTTEEMNTDLDLSSSVEVNFRGEPVSLERLASSSQVGRIQANARNPEAEMRAADQERAARQQRQAASEQQRRQALDTDLTPHPIAQEPHPPAAHPQAAAGAGQHAAAGGQQPAQGAAGHSSASTGAQQPQSTPAAQQPTASSPQASAT